MTNRVNEWASGRLTSLNSVVGWIKYY